MIKYIKGTVFNSNAKTIVNTVNCSGIMGAGIALEFKLRYPEMYEEYVKHCENEEMKLGIPKIYEYSDKRWIMNFPTKGHWRFPSKIKWIEDGLKYFVANYKKRNIESIAFPKLGTHNGGLEWDEIKIIMEKYLSQVDIPVYICLDEINEGEGAEKEMLEKLNSIDLNKKYKEIGISKKAAEVIIDSLPVSRFWHISKIKGVSKTAYDKLFTYLYQSTTEYKQLNNKNDLEQISFLDI